MHLLCNNTPYIGSEIVYKVVGLLYIYGKKQLREIDRRVRYLEKRLEAFTVVDRLPEDQSSIYFGAWVTLEDDEENIKHFRIVGPDELDHDARYISIDSPMAKALLKKHEGDEIELKLASGLMNYTVEEIEYKAIP